MDPIEECLTRRSEPNMSTSGIKMQNRFMNNGLKS